MLDFTENYTKFEFEKINEELFLNLVSGSDKQFHGRIGKMNLKVSQNSDMSNSEDLEINTAANIAKVSSSTAKASTEAWDISFTYSGTTYYMKYSDIYTAFSTGSIKDTPYTKGTYYIETVEDDICVVKGDDSNSFKIIPRDANLKFIDPVVIKIEQNDSGVPTFRYNNQLISFDIETFPEDSFIMDVKNNVDYDHLTIGAADGKDRLVIFKEDDIITQDYSEKIIVFQYYNTESPNDVYSLKLKTLDDFRNVVIERDATTQYMKKLTLTLSQSDLSGTEGTCVIVAEFGEDGAISSLKKAVGSDPAALFDGTAPHGLLNYALYIEKTDVEGENNEILIPNEAPTNVTIDFSALLFGYPIRKVIASYGENDIEIIRENEDYDTGDFIINTLKFNLPYNTAEDSLDDGTHSCVYYCAGNVLTNMSYSIALGNTLGDDFAPFHVDGKRTLTDPVFYVFNILGNKILGDIAGKIETFTLVEFVGRPITIYNFNNTLLNVLSIETPGKAPIVVSNNFNFKFSEGQVGTPDKYIESDIGFNIDDYTDEVIVASASNTIYKGVIAAVKIENEGQYGILFILEDGNLYWSDDDTNKELVAQVYIKDMILHYGWHKTIECGKVLVTHDNADIKDMLDQANTAYTNETGDDDTKQAAKASALESNSEDILDKYGCSMIVDQHLKTVLIRELITRDFQRDSLNLLYCLGNKIVISPVGLFSDVSLADGGHLFIANSIYKICDRCFTGTENMKLSYTLFNDDNVPYLFDAACMFQNLNITSDKNASIVVYGYRMRSVASMFKDAHFTGKELMICSVSMNLEGDYIHHSEETTAFDGRCCFEHAIINVPTEGFRLTFNNYKEYDLSNFYAYSTISSFTKVSALNNLLDLLVRVNDDSESGDDNKIVEYYPHVIMSSFLEGATLPLDASDKLIIDLDTIFCKTYYRVFQCDNMLVGILNKDNKVVLKENGGNIKFQAATTDFNPRDIFGLVRPKLIKWLIKSISEDGKLLRIHSH